MREEPYSLQDGLISAKAWSSAYEGPFTRLAKLATLNALPARDLCQMLFGRSLLHHHGRPWHGRSLLSDTWLRSRPLRSDVAAEIARRTLEHLCGAWASRIASDAHLRYCPMCLRDGFQSAVFQIDALQICPIHGQSLQEACPHCAAPTAAYAVTAEGFDRPFHCHACGGPLACNADAAHWERTWQTPRGVQSLQPLIAWLKAIKGAPLQWPDVDVWLLDPRGDVDRQRRCSVFSVLRQIVPLESRIQSQAPLSLHVYRDVRCTGAEGRPLLLDGPLTRARCAIYKSLRRHFRKSLGIDTARREVNTRDFEYEGSARALLPQPMLSSSSLHGFLLWRQRFEEGFQVAEEWIHAPSAHPLRLRPPMERWPIVREVSHSLWAQFALECLHEDLWTAQQWLDVCSSIEPTGMPRIDRSMTELARLNQWKHRMSADIFPWPTSLTHLTQNGAGAEGGLLFVAPVRGAATRVVHVDRGGGLLSPGHNAPRPSPRASYRVLPLERLELPAHLDGREGRHRVHGEPCRIAATNDRDAVQAWILASGVAASTATLYRSAGERLLNWCWIEKGKALSSLDREDFAEFARFLAHPEPVDRWIGARAPRDTPQWRPFTQPPSPASCAFTLACIKALLRWLTDQRYAVLRMQAGRRHFEREGISDVPTTYHHRRPSQSEPLAIDEWLYIRHALGSFERDGIGLPIRLLVELMYYGSLSWEQISKLTFSSVEPARNDDAWCVWILRGQSDDAVYPVAAPPPLARTLRAWLLSCRGMELRSLLSQPLLPIDLASPTRHIRSLMTRAAAHAEAVGRHAIAESLAHRSARALKNAFALHEQILLGGRKPTFESHSMDISNRVENLHRRWVRCEALWAPLESSEDAAEGARRR